MLSEVVRWWSGDFSGRTRYDRCVSWVSFAMDHLYHGAGAAQALHDKPMLDRWATLNELTATERERVLSVMDALIRDSKARKTYGGEQGG
jgi:hypothetical protein